VGKNYLVSLIGKGASMNAGKRELIIATLMLLVCMIVGCGDKSTSDPVVVVPPADPFAQDTLAVRKILDTNGLTQTPVGSVITNRIVFGIAPPDTTKRIDRLNLKNKNIIVIPGEIGQLTRMRYLSLDSNAMSALPPEIGHCTALIHLTVSYNHLISIPPEIGALVSLRRLELTHNALTTLPEQIGNLKLLDNLWLDFNGLTTLPATISSLDSLQMLALNDNKLTELPTTMYQLPKMYLTIINNKLCSLTGALKTWVDDNADPGWIATQQCP
jgi:Leucine-rich repeat (LRR) protein